MRIRVKQFQAIQEADILAEGFTVVTGRTNLGKTALIRAINGALFGLPGDHYIKDGTQGTVVRIEDTNLDVKWKKVINPKPGHQSALTVNGTEHTKIGRDHKTLTDPLGFKEIETTGARLRPQIALQHDPIFLLTETETTTAEVFKQLGRTDIVTHAQSKAAKDKKADESLLKTRTEDRKKIELELEALEDTAWIARKRDLAKKTEKEARKSIDRLKSIEDLLQRLDLQTERPINATTPPEPNIPTLPLELLTKLDQLKPNPTKAQQPTINLEPNPAIQLIDTLQTLKKEGRDLKTEREQIQTLILTLQEEIEELEKQATNCPTCGRPLQ